MRVVVEDNLFQRASWTPLLVTLFFHAMKDHHRVLADPTGPYHTWAAALDPETRRFCDDALSFSALAESLEPATLEISVTSEAVVHWTPPRFPLLDGLELLQRPFKIVVEDANADRAFVLSMCTAQQRTFLEEREKHGLLEFVHGGGVSSMKKLVEKLTKDSSSGLTTFVLFDSDALQPGIPSSQCEQLRGACGAAIPHHQLSRRFIESYLPLRTLSDWAASLRKSKKRKKARHRVNAYATLSPAQRHHYNLKKGFSEDDKRAQTGGTAGTLYDGVPPFTRQALAHGLDSNLSALFDPPGTRMSEQDLKADGSWIEGSALTSRIIALAR